MESTVKAYYNPDDECWWAYLVDAEGNQVGDAEPAQTKELAIRYLKMFVKDNAKN